MLSSQVSVLLLHIKKHRKCSAFDGQFEDLDYNPSSVVIDELLKEEIESKLSVPS